MKNAINILAMIFAWGALILSIFAFGDMTGNILKAVTYGLIVGNAVLVNFICVHNLKEKKQQGISDLIPTQYRYKVGWVSDHAASI